jgi:hypothetical protein
MELVKTVKMGGSLLISGAERAVVEAALAAQVKRGAKVVSPVHQLGAKWMASCEDLDDPVRRCEVLRIGGQLMIKGPGRDAVQAKLDELLANGAKLVSAPRGSDGSWVAVCQPAGESDVYDRW